MTCGLHEVRRALARGPLVIICDHATSFVPEELNQLGLTAPELARHIGWDIGAAAVAEILSARFDSPLILSGTSRLVVDYNRHVDAPDLMPVVSDGTIVPGNSDLTQRDRLDRLTNYFHPYHDAIEQVLQERENCIFLSVHSMTERLGNEWRPWPVALSSFEDRRLTDPMLLALRAYDEFPVGDNQPYDLDPKFDFSTPYHALRRGLRHLQVEFRQDEIAAEAGQKKWAKLFGDAFDLCGR